MPKISNYPRKSFDTAMSIAETVEKLGGKCSEQLLGDKLGKKKGGSFQADINSAVKHGLITKEKDNLKITDLFKNIKLSYTEKEKLDNMAKAFLLPDTYREILERFNGKELPIDVLDKMLIKEYQIADNISQTVANNLIKGAEQIGLIKGGIVTLSEETIELAEEQAAIFDNEKEQDQNSNKNESAKQIKKNGLSGTIKENLSPNLPSQKDVVININIQLTVPETTNEEVYEKFFSAMKRNLLS